MADHISYGEFGVRFVHEAVTDERVADAIAAIAGGSVEVGPLSAGPGGLARAGAKGRIGWPRIRADRDREPVTVAATLPVELDLRVDVAGASHRYRCDLEVALRLVLRTAVPLALVVDVEPVRTADVTVAVEASGVRARVLQRVGNLEDEVRRHVAAFVADRVSSDAAHDARVIELLPLINRAWSEGA